MTDTSSGGVLATLGILLAGKQDTARAYTHTHTLLHKLTLTLAHSLLGESGQATQPAPHLLEKAHPPLGASAKPSLKGPLVALGWRSWKRQVPCSLEEGDAGQGMGQGRVKRLQRHQMGKGHLLSSTHSSLAAQPAPWAQKSLGSIKGAPCVLGRH